MTPTASRLPLWFKLIYTAFVAVLVPTYWYHYGPGNFLYFCDLALLLTGVAIWMESAVLVSACAVGILLPQMLWMLDFLFTGLGWPITGMTTYMYEPRIPWFTRFLSFFHFWQPPVLVWLLWRLGYDRRGLVVWWPIGWAAMLASYLWLPPPPAPADQTGLPVNVNFVFGLDGQGAQTWMPPHLYLGVLMLALLVLLWWPSHWLLSRIPAFARTPVDRSKAR